MGNFSPVKNRMPVPTITRFQVHYTAPDITHNAFAPLMRAVHARMASSYKHCSCPFIARLRNALASDFNQVNPSYLGYGGTMRSRKDSAARRPLDGQNGYGSEKCILAPLMLGNG